MTKPMLHRFHCHSCGAQLTDWVEQARETELLALHASHTALMPRGYAIASSETSYARVFTEPRWMLAPLPRACVAFHSDRRRTVGCCGLSYRKNEANLVCAKCQTEVAIGYEDCCGPHWAALAPEVAHEVDASSVEVDDERVRRAIARLDEVLKCGGALQTSKLPEGPRHNNICSDEPEDWAQYALNLEGASLALEGAQLIVRGESLATDQQLVVATPRVMLIRLLCASITPWGDLDCPLIWRADDAEGKSMGEVSVALDASTDRVLLMVCGREAQKQAIVMGSDAWLGAWEKLRARLRHEA